MTFWLELKKQPLNSAEVQGEVVWNNRHIIIGSKAIFIKTLYDNGKPLISDILDMNGKFLNYDMLIEKYGLNITEYACTCLNHVISLSWRKVLKEHQFMHIDPKNKLFSLNTA